MRRDEGWREKIDQSWARRWGKVCYMICIELEVPNLQKIHELPLVQERTKIYQQ